MDREDFSNDVNYNAYRKLYDEGHLVHFKGNYVGIVEGILVDFDSKDSELIKRLRKTFPNKAYFYKKVVENEESEALPLDILDRFYFD